MESDRLQHIIKDVDPDTLQNLIKVLRGVKAGAVNRVGPESPPDRPGRLFVKTRVIVKKFESDDALAQGKAYEIGVSEGNVAINNGIQIALDQIINVSTQPYWAGNSLVGVGNDSTAEAATQSGLIGASQAWAGMDATYPSRSAQTVSWQGSFPAAVANFAWNEFTVINTSSSVRSLIRRVSAQGTKTSGQVWQLTLQITMS